MDTLFRLVSFQQPQQQYDDDQSSLNNNNNNNNNNSTNSSSSRSSKPTHHYYHPPYPHPHHFHQEEECFNFFMDEEDFSSSSSHHNKHHHNNFNPTFTYQPNTFDPPSTTTTTSTPTHHSGGASGGCGGGGGGGFESSSSATATATAAFTYSPPRDINLDFFSTNNNSNEWATQILIEAAKAIADRNTERLHQLLWMLNEVGSPYGDVEQKLACYFSQALFTRMTHSGDRYSHSMRVAADKTFSFDTTRKMLLQFQEVSPWTTFGHVASNGAIVDAFDGESKLHILDFSTTFCTQWPTLLEAIATRMDDTPHLRITTVVVDKPPSHGGSDGGGGGGNFQRVMREIGIRLEKFARLMGVPFKFNVIHHVGDLSDLDFSVLEIHDDEALAINCVNSLHSVNIHRRDVVLAAFRRLNPRLVTVVEENADLIDVGPDGYPFFRGFGECLKWFRVYLESLDDCFSKTSNEKLMLERAAGRALVDLLARPESDSSERRETGGRWSGRIRSAGFGHVAFSDEVCDDVRALLRRYKDGWSMAQCNGESGGGIFLSWKDQPVVWASAWKP